MPTRLPSLQVPGGVVLPSPTGALAVAQQVSRRHDRRLACVEKGASSSLPGSISEQGLEDPSLPETPGVAAPAELQGPGGGNDSRLHHAAEQHSCRVALTLPTGCLGTEHKRQPQAPASQPASPPPHGLCSDTSSGALPYPMPRLTQALLTPRPWIRITPAAANQGSLLCPPAQRSHEHQATAREAAPPPSDVSGFWPPSGEWGRLPGTAHGRPQPHSGQGQAHPHTNTQAPAHLPVLGRGKHARPGVAGQVRGGPHWTPTHGPERPGHWTAQAEAPGGEKRPQSPTLVIKCMRQFVAHHHANPAKVEGPARRREDQDGGQAPLTQGGRSQCCGPPASQAAGQRMAGHAAPPLLCVTPRPHCVPGQDSRAPPPPLCLLRLGCSYLGELRV